MKVYMEEKQITMFGDETDAPEAIMEEDKNLDVVKASFIEGKKMHWRELFKGYDSIYAITYSSGLEFMGKVVDMFEKAEIIFGCERIISEGTAEIMGFQQAYGFQHAFVKRIADNPVKDKLIKRIQANTLRMYVVHEMVSHEKIYLLSAKDGRKRVITGSANMSRHAFTAMQRENITFFDDAEAYDYYYSIYEEVKNECTDEITEKTIAVVNTNSEDVVDELPISNTVSSKRVLVIEPNRADENDITFALDVKRLTGKYEKVKPKADKNGKTMITPEAIKSIKAHIKDENVAEKNSRQEFPQLVVNISAKMASLNDVPYDLAPGEAEIKNDVELFMQYMKGFENFHGQTEEMQMRYFEFANWFFCSPFMAAMRDTAAMYDQPNLPYPVFGIIYGQSKAGKTSFLETLYKMMIGQKTKIAAKEFTRKSIDGLRHEVKGAPIIVDDLTKTRFDQHAVETIKNDMFGNSEHNVNYPAVVISANDDLKSVTQEIMRRTVICRVNAGLTNTEVMKSNMVKRVQKNVGTAFYREYLYRMFDIVPNLINELKDDESETAPDILHYSSEVIYDIITEYYSGDLPLYIRKLNIDDYFSEKKTGSNVIRIIKTAWRTDKGSFRIDKARGKLIYNAGQTYEADRIIRELPETLLAEKARDSVVMDLKEAQKFFEEPFKLGILDKYRNYLSSRGH